MIDDPTRVYLAWPLEKVIEAANEFRDIMHDGAGIQELQAGLHGLDFMCRGSDIPDPWASIIDARVDEAYMRIELMALQEAEQRTWEETIEKAHKTLTHMKTYLRGFMPRMHRNGAEALLNRFPSLQRPAPEEEF